MIERPNTEPEDPANAIASLAFPEQFLVWAARLWVAKLKEPMAALPSLHAGFQMAGVPDSLLGLDAVLGAVAESALRPLDVRCLKCRSLGADEALLLRAVSLAQHNRFVESARIIAEWLPPMEARIAHRHLRALASEFLEADLSLPLRPSPTAEHACPAGYGDIGLTLVH